MKTIKYLRLIQTGEDTTTKLTQTFYVKNKNIVTVKKESLTTNPVENTALLKTIVLENTATSKEPLLLVIPNIEIGFAFRDKYVLPDNVFIGVMDIGGEIKPYITRDMIQPNQQGGANLSTINISTGKLLPCLTIYEQGFNPEINLRRQTVEVEGDLISECPQTIIGRPVDRADMPYHEAFLIKGDKVTKMVVANKTFYGAISMFNGVGSTITNEEAKNNLKIQKSEIHGLFRVLEPIYKRDNELLTVSPQAFYIPWATKPNKMPYLNLHFKEAIKFSKPEYAQLSGTNTTGFIGLNEESKVCFAILMEANAELMWDEAKTLNLFKDCVFDFPVEFHTELRTMTHNTYGKARVIIQWLEQKTAKRKSRSNINYLTTAHIPTKEEMMEAILSGKDTTWK